MQAPEKPCRIYLKETAISKEAGYKLTLVTTSLHSPSVLMTLFHHPKLFAGIKLNEHFDGGKERYSTHLTSPLAHCCEETHLPSQNTA